MTALRKFKAVADTREKTGWTHIATHCCFDRGMRIDFLSGSHKEPHRHTRQPDLNRESENLFWD